MNIQIVFGLTQAKRQTVDESFTYLVTKSMIIHLHVPYAGKKTTTKNNYSIYRKYQQSVVPLLVNKYKPF